MIFLNTNLFSSVLETVWWVITLFEVLIIVNDITDESLVGDDLHFRPIRISKWSSVMIWIYFYPKKKLNRQGCLNFMGLKNGENCTIS